MNLESPKVGVDLSPKKIFDFLSDLNNFKRLMPKNLESFDSNTTSFSFKLSGMPLVLMKLKEKKPDHLVLLEANDGKFQFELECNINAISESRCQIQFLFDGSFNPLMRMMVKKPLENLLDTFSDKISEI